MGRYYHIKTADITQDCPSKPGHMITCVICKKKEVTERKDGEKVGNEIKEKERK